MKYILTSAFAALALLVASAFSAQEQDPYSLLRQYMSVSFSSELQSKNDPHLPKHALRGNSYYI